MEPNSPLYLQVAVVVFREILEIALILGILASATKNIAGRGKWLFGGLACGLALSVVLGMLTDQISQSLNGLGQEIFNGSLMLSASAMIGWTVIWMQKHGKTISSDLKQVSREIHEGKKPLYALAIVVLLSVLREGAEVVLFCYSYFVAGTPIFSIILGLTIGIAGGSALGFAFYLGLMKSLGRYFFAITGWLLIFFAAGTCATAMRFFVSAQLISPIHDPLFNLSEIVPLHSLFGKTLHVLIGYVDRPSALEFIAYSLVLVVLCILMKRSKSNDSQKIASQKN